MPLGDPPIFMGRVLGPEGGGKLRQQAASFPSPCVVLGDKLLIFRLSS